MPRQKKIHSSPPLLPGNKETLVWILGIAAITIIAYFPAFANGVTNWDDDRYLLNNPLIRDLSLSNLSAIFSQYYFCNYHPLTLLSYAMEYSFVGTNPFLYHFTNILIHTMNTILVFRLMQHFFSKIEIAAIIAMLFGVHTLHVESVAWISGRKDVLYTFFYLIALLGYIQYIKKKKIRFYFLAVIMLIMSALSKGMAVSLFFSIVIIDYFFERKFLSKKVIFEKIPFLLIAIVFGIIAILAQKSEQAITIKSIPFLDRTLYVAYGFCQYLIKLIVPSGLSAFYPYPEKATFAYWLYLFAAVIIIGLFIYSKKYSRQYITGFLFFFLNILFVLQLLPVGNAMMADRYSYIPSIGFFFIAGAAYQNFSFRYGRWTTLLRLVAFLYVILLAGLTFNRCKIWNNSMALWDDTLEKYPCLPSIYSNRGICKFETQNYNGAIADYTKALEFQPDLAEARFNRANALMEINKYNEALNDYNQVISFNPPKVIDAYYKRGFAKKELGDYTGAIADFTKVLAMDSLYGKAWFGMATAKFLLNDYTGAIGDYTKEIQINPGFYDAYLMRGTARSDMGDVRGAIADFSQAIAVTPDIAEAWFNRANSWFKLNEPDSALADYTRVIGLNPPKVSQAYYFRGGAYLKKNMQQEACNDFKKAAELGYTPASGAIGKYCRVN